MHTAATFGRIGLIKFLLSSTTPDGPSLLLEKDKTNGNLPICDAVIRGDTRLVNYLLTQDTRAKNVYSDGNILAHFRNKFKESLIHMASELGNPVILSMVLEEFALSGALGRDQVKAIINSKTMMGETCLHLAAIAVAGAGLGASNNDSEFSPVSCLAMLVNRGGDLSIRNADGETPAQISGIKV